MSFVVFLLLLLSLLRTFASKTQLFFPKHTHTPKKQKLIIDRGRVLANIWFQDVIVVINPETGIVEKEYGTGIPTNKKRSRLYALACPFLLLLLTTSVLFFVDNVVPIYIYIYI